MKDAKGLRLTLLIVISSNDSSPPLLTVCFQLIFLKYQNRKLLCLFTLGLEPTSRDSFWLQLITPVA